MQIMKQTNKIDTINANPILTKSAAITCKFEKNPIFKNSYYSFSLKFIAIHYPSVYKLLSTYLKPVLYIFSESNDFGGSIGSYQENVINLVYRSLNSMLMALFITVI